MVMNATSAMPLTIESRPRGLAPAGVPGQASLVGVADPGALDLGEVGEHPQEVGPPVAEADQADADPGLGLALRHGRPRARPRRGARGWPRRPGGARPRG